MDPKRAAEVAARLKDALPVKDQEIAALQSRLQQATSSSANSASAVLSQDQLSKTFESMNAKQAASLLIGMADVSPAKFFVFLGGERYDPFIHSGGDVDY